MSGEASKHLELVVQYLEELLEEIRSGAAQDSTHKHIGSILAERIVNEDGVTIDFRWHQGVEVIVFLPWDDNAT